MDCSPPLGERGWLEPACEWRMRPEGHVPSTAMTPEQLCACFGAYFEDYHYASRWWLTVELTVALVSGMIGGLMVTSAGCLVVQALALVPNAAYLALLLWRRPFQCRLDFATCAVVGALLFASAVATVAGSEDVSESAALGASIVGLVPTVCTPYKLAQQLRTMRRLKLQRREGEKKRLADSSLLAEEEDKEAATTPDPIMEPLLVAEPAPPPPPPTPLPTATVITTPALRSAGEGDVASNESHRLNDDTNLDLGLLFDVASDAAIPPHENGGGRSQRFAPGTIGRLLDNLHLDQTQHTDDEGPLALL